MSEVENMVDAIEKLVDKKIANAMRGDSSTVPATYMGTDSEGKAWVVLAGADAATPVRRTSVEAARGDMVSVTVADGMAVIDANLTDKSAGVASVAKADAKAVVAQETAVEAIDYASQASAAASTAYSAAQTAQASADSAVADAARANEAATQAVSDAATAHEAADSAQESADKATYALSDVERVVGTVNWIAEHGRYELTEDTAVDGSKSYYTRSGSGTTADPYVYAVVAEPKASELSTYYELHIDESVQNFINSHVWLEQDGLYVGTQGSDYRARIDANSFDVLDELETVVASFGESVSIGRDGETHLTIGNESVLFRDSAGVPLIEMSNNSAGHSYHFEFTGDGTSRHFEILQAVSGTALASEAVFVDGVQVNAAIQSQDFPDQNSIFLSSAELSDVPRNGASIDVYVSVDAETSLIVGSRYWTGSARGTNTLGVGYHASADGNNSIAVGREVIASGAQSAAFGNGRASGKNSFIAGLGNHAEGIASVAFGYGTDADSDYQLVAGKHNVPDSNGDYVLIVGNGSSASSSNRSNAITVDWSGNVECQGTVNGVDLSEVGTVETAAAASVSVPTGANTDMRSISLGAGVWAVTGRAQFANNQTGRRAVKLSTTSQESGNVPSTLSILPVSGGYTQMSTTRVFSLQSASTVYLVGWQNSGGALACYGEIEATRIG